MAISELLPGIEVVVTVDGKGLQEYPDDDAEAEERTTTSYIEAMTGKHFGIRVTTKSDFQLHGDALMVVFKVDGFKSDSFVVHREDMTVSSSTWSSRGSWSTGELRKYQFSAVQIGRWASHESRHHANCRVS